MPFFDFFKKDPTIEILNIIKNIIEKKLTAQNTGEKTTYQNLHQQLIFQRNSLTPQPNDFSPSSRAKIIGILDSILLLASTLKEPQSITRATVLVAPVIDMAEKFGLVFSKEAIKQSSFAAATQQNACTLEVLNAYVAYNRLTPLTNNI